MASSAGAPTAAATAAAGLEPAWRAPLRQALDDLRDALRRSEQERARALQRSVMPRANDYIDVILDRSDEVRR